MDVSFTKQQAKENIHLFFQRERFSSRDLKKIRTVAMKYRIRLGAYRARFCKKCFSDTRTSTVKLTGMHKTILCPSCGYLNKVRIS